jgi:hypothetical protein
VEMVMAVSVVSVGLGQWFHLAERAE